jgi:hypothetical protein
MSVLQKAYQNRLEISGGMGGAIVPLYRIAPPVKTSEPYLP